MIGWIILALVLVFLAVILIRTAAFTPKAESRAAVDARPRPVRNARREILTVRMEKPP